MDSSHSALERAFQIARSGRVLNFQELRKALGKEGYAANQIDGPALRRQLREIIRQSRRASASDSM